MTFYSTSELEINKLIRGEHAEEVRHKSDEADQGKKLGRRAR